MLRREGRERFPSKTKENEGRRWSRRWGTGSLAHKKKVGRRRELPIKRDPKKLGYWGKAQQHTQVDV